MDEEQPAPPGTSGRERLGSDAVPAAPQLLSGQVPPSAIGPAGAQPKPFSTTRSAVLHAILYALYLLALGAALWLLWLVRDLPSEPALLNGNLRIDGLSTFFALATLWAALMGTLGGEQRRWRTLFASGALLLAYSSAHLLGIVAGFGLATLLSAQWVNDRWYRALHPRLLDGLAWASLGLGYVAIGVQTGIWRYNVTTAGAGLNSFVFWFVLLAALLGGAGFGRTADHMRPAPLFLALAWFYPLMRLYSLGPWNQGWLFATLLLGAALALWSVWRARSAPTPAVQVAWLMQMYAGIAFAGIGLGSGAGLAATSYAVLVAPLLALGLPSAQPTESQLHADQAIADRGSGEPPLAAEPDAEPRHANQLPPIAIVQAQVPGGSRWLLSGALPLTAPFVAIWMSTSAAAAGQIWLLAGAIWLAALIAALIIVQLPPPGPRPFAWRVALASGLSIVLGITAPSIIQFLITPLILQLQGGLTPFGDVAFWPWGGIVALDSARKQVAALPSLALLVLMLVLGALAWLLSRLAAIWWDNRRG